MNRSQRTAFCLGLAILVSAVLSGGESPLIESAQLKAEDLEGVNRNGSVHLLGFAWEGEARLFEAELFMADLATPGTNEVVFSILGKGGPAVCEGLTKRTSEGNRLDKARLTFRSAAGAGTTFKLAGVTTQRADCGAKPWTASLVAERVGKAAERAKQKKVKKQGQALRLERAAARS